MHRLIQPGWLLFQAAIFGGMMWVFEGARAQGENLGSAPFIISAFTAWACTVILLILNEGRKDLMRLLRGEPKIVHQKPIALGAREVEAGRLASPRILAKLEAAGRSVRRRLR